MSERARPAGTVTFLFTDVAGSTRLWHQHPDAMRAWLARHDAEMSAVVDSHRGVLFKHTGDGACAVFAVAADAVAAAVEAQARVGSVDVGLPDPVRVRMGLHAGEAEPAGDDYFGPPLNRCARIRDLGHGGQTLCSAAVVELVRDHMPGDVQLADAGRHVLRDLPGTEHVFEVRATGDREHFPPLRAQGARHDRLPRPATPFIGRDKELADVQTLLGESRLVTLLGPGGMGKTRLAIQAAASLPRRLDLGACFIDLVSTSDEARVDVMAAEALGVAVPPGRPARDELAAHIGDASVLVLFDNCEHVLDAAASLADHLLATCGAAIVLATSREPLRLAAERVFRVPPLTLRGTDSSSDAVRLFVERAERVGARIEPADFSVVSEICTHVDGLPLAIELAAARARHLTPAQILDRLGDRFKLLRSNERDADERHRTLRATIDWSHELLDDGEQSVFRRLAVFAGDFELEFAEGVCGFDGVDGDDVFDIVASLVDRSLVVTSDGRYALLETVREYAGEQLDRAGERDATCARHAEFFAARAHNRSDQVVASLGWTTVRAPLDDLDNVYAAFHWALSHDIDLARAILADAWPDLLDSGAWTDLQSWLDAVDVDEAQGAQRVSLLAAGAYIQQMFGAMAVAFDAVEALLPLALAEQPGVVPTLLVVQGVSAQASGRSDPASLFARAGALAAEQGNDMAAAEAAEQLGEYMLNQGRLDEAEVALERALALSRGSERVWPFMTAALVALFNGNTQRSLQLAEDAVGVASDLRPFSQMYSRVVYALAVAAAGEADAAADALCWTVDAAGRFAVPLMLNDVLAAAGGVALYAGDAERAASLLGAARTEFGRTGSWRRPAGGAIYVYFCDRARAELGPEQYEAARQRGRSLDLEAALDLVPGRAAPRG
jgi:predicted ATPase/class 3 adenylate cyclase